MGDSFAPSGKFVRLVVLLWRNELSCGRLRKNCYESRVKVCCMKRNIFALVLILILGVPVCCSQVQYFPNLSLSENQSYHNSLAKWYTEELSLMNEPSLWETS